MEHGDRNHVAVQIEELLTSAKCCIYRVPHEIRELNPAAYTPKVVSIGPLHHGDPKLLPMEGHKQVYCLKFIERCRSKVSLDELVSYVRKLEPEVRQCYSDKIKLNEEELVKVILVDCSFVIELFLRSHHFGYYTHDDVILFKPWLEGNIKFDFLLLENQLPFFILEKLYKLAFHDGDYPPFLKLTSQFFGALGEKFPSAESKAHFTDLFRTSLLQSSHKQPPRSEVEILKHLHSATELNEAGVKFRVNSKSQCILDLQFSGCCCCCCFKIPQIKVEDSTEMLFRNVMALEHCHYPYDSYFIDCMVVLNFLINTDKDVDVLVKHGIIVNWLGDSNEVAKLFNGLGKNIICSGFNEDYLDIGAKLNAYCKHPLHTKIATLKRDYCNTPWKTAASFAGITLLILTIIQTVFSVR